VHTTKSAWLACSTVAVAAVIAIALPSPAHGAPVDTAVFEVTGSGTVYTIDTDPSTDRVYDATVPWSKTITVGADVTLLQVVAVGKEGTQGCRITLNGKVVVEKAPGTEAHCIFERS
jgi:Mycobacterium membrane protein